MMSVTGTLRMTCVDVELKIFLVDRSKQTTKWADHPAWKGTNGYTDRTGRIVLALLIDRWLAQRGDLRTEHTLDCTEQAFFVKFFCLARIPFVQPHNDG